MSRNQDHPMRTSIPHPPRRHQSGLSLIVVLLALVTLSFAAVGLIRSIDTGTLVIGNLGFKKAATASSDQAVDVAVPWMTAQTQLSATSLYNSLPANGYYASSLTNLDPAGNSAMPSRARVDWDNNACDNCVSAGTCSACITPSPVTNTADGYSHRYVIARMCRCEGDPNSNCAGTSVPNSCPVGQAAGGSPKKGEVKYGDEARFEASGLGTHFRIIVRTTGPKDTSTITETYVQF